MRGIAAHARPRVARPARRAPSAMLTASPTAAAARDSGADAMRKAK
jgi:hypothetical protein